jgi:arsenate reductase
MAEKLEVWMKQGCVTCRRVLDHLEARRVPMKLRDIVQDKPTEAEIREVLAKLHLPARELLRSRDRMYRELRLSKRELPEGELIRLMAQNPGLLRRPILIRRQRAAVAPDPKAAEAILP